MPVVLRMLRTIPKILERNLEELCGHFIRQAQGMVIMLNGHGNVEMEKSSERNRAILNNN